MEESEEAVLVTLQEIQELDQAHAMQCFARLPVCFVRGSGTRLWDTEGKEYLDFLAGIAVCGLGHCHPRITAAIREQAGKLVHTSNLFYNAEQARVAKILAEVSGGYKAFFGNSGAEANEGAIKLARKWGKLHRGPQCVEIITAVNSFHGRTLLTVSATGQEKVKKYFDPLVPGFHHVPLNDVRALADAVNENTVAVMLELVQGESGVHVCEPEYVQEVQRLCAQRQVLLILDEVQCGLCRTGSFFAWQGYHITPDIFTLAKPIANGLPMGVVMARPGVAEAFQPGDHGSTFGGNHLVCAAAAAVLETMREEGLDRQAGEMGRYFQERLRELASKHPKILEIRGLGLMVGVELREPEAKQVVTRCLERGLVINAVGEYVLRFLPALTVTRAEVDQAVAVLDAVL